MTLHWWMHWFWVTMLLLIMASSRGTLAAPQSEELQHITTAFDGHRQTDSQSLNVNYSNTPQITTLTTPVTDVADELRGNNSDQQDRQGRALYFTKTPQVTPNVTEDPTANVTVTDPMNPTSIQWTPVNSTDVLNPVQNSTAAPSVNVTQFRNTTLSQTTKKRNQTRPDFVKDSNVEVESRIVTEKSLSLETTYLQTRIPPNVESSRRVIDQEGSMDTGVIAGISFAALVLAALAGSTAFVLYRRRYLNKPQTLNDKCSNPDSSGYLDDSTVRDNSEEMYSLDNDSFLNSLEAMTIQNYWTDTVKHTKL